MLRQRPGAGRASHFSPNYLSFEGGHFCPLGECGEEEVGCSAFLPLVIRSRTVRSCLLIGSSEIYATCFITFFKSVCSVKSVVNVFLLRFEDFKRDKR